MRLGDLCVCVSPAMTGISMDLASREEQNVITRLGWSGAKRKADVPG